MNNEAFVDLFNNRQALLIMLAELGLLDSAAASAGGTAVDSTDISALDAPALPSLQVTALAGGVSSNIFRIDLPQGAYCIKQALPKLKVSSDWRAPVTRVFAEIDWLNFVATIAPANVPKVIASHPASGAFVMPFLASRDWANWKLELLAGRIEPARAAQVGDLLGRIHATSAATPALAQRFANAENFLALRLDPYLLETARRTPALAAVLQGLVARTERNTKVLIHGDVSPKNILVSATHVLLLDAECATWGDPAFDLAFLLNHFMLKAVHLADSRTVLLAAADTLTSAYWPHVQWEDQLELEARTASLLAGLMLARIDGKSPVEYLSDSARIQVRALAQGLLRSLPTKLRELTDVLRLLPRA